MPDTGSVNAIEGAPAARTRSTRIDPVAIALPWWMWKPVVASP
jgi:hypothetical protein